MSRAPALPLFETGQQRLDDASLALSRDIAAKPPTHPTVEPTERSWFMAIACPTRPRCPGCGARLLPKVTYIAFDIIWCESCGSLASRSRHHDYLAPPLDQPQWTSLETHNFIPYVFAVRSLAGDSELHCHHGIIAWTPPIAFPDLDVYLRWLSLKNPTDPWHRRD